MIYIAEDFVWNTGGSAYKLKARIVARDIVAREFWITASDDSVDTSEWATLCRVCIPDEYVYILEDAEAFIDKVNICLAALMLSNERLIKQHTLCEVFNSAVALYELDLREKNRASKDA